MRVMIDNFDGLGLTDYTSCIQFGKEAQIRRVLNAPSTCKLTLVPHEYLASPRVNARLVIQSASGIPVFTGYISQSPYGLALGTGSQGGIESLVIEAISDEALLDEAVWTANTTVFSNTAAQSWNILGSLCSESGLQLKLADGSAASSRVILAGGNRWSELANELSASTRSSYRALDGVVDVAPIGSRVHGLMPNDPGVELTPIPGKDLHWLADDIIVAGHEEPDAYVTELFAGDGLTSTFRLSQTPFRPKAGQVLKLVDLFQGTSIDQSLWSVIDTGGHIGLTAGGLTCAGGSGRQNESCIFSVQVIEMGGNISLEAQGVQLAPGSVGTILGLYMGSTSTANCFAGFSVTSVQAGVTIGAAVNGMASGSVFTTTSGHLYTLRLRVYSPEIERVRQSYSCLADDAAFVIGGDTVPSAGWLELEVQDVTNGTTSQITVLYSGEIPSIPPSCSLGLLASGSLTCSIKSVHCTQSAPVQVAISAQASSQQHLILGTTAEGAACHLTSSGEIIFYPAAVPAASTIVAVCYRSSKASIARRISPAIDTAISSWAGSVLHPPAWSSVDCENAAKALLAFGTAKGAALKGKYVVERVFSDDDIWPGDSLQFFPLECSSPQQATIRAVVLEILDAENEVIGYRAEIANDWAEALSIRISSRLPTSFSVPQSATAIDTSLVSLNSLTVTSVTPLALTFSAGIEAPVNGGFEIRRRDATFGPGTDSDLVLRTGAQTFSVPRMFAIEQFFVRMYDGSDPPVYSAQSAAVFVNVSL